MKEPVKENRIIEYIVFLIFCILLMILLFFHEPWYDEAQAWQISRLASLRDILFDVPHWEGHPPFWNLLLMIPAKAGLPYEESIKVTAFLPAAFSAFLILIRSPFQRPIRIALPFTYFFFYQYGVLSRPYGLMVTALLLIAMTFKDRNKKPLRFILSLLFLCLWSGYGIVLSGGIAICYCIDIILEKKKDIFKIPFWKEKRTLELIGLLLCALVLTALILPDSKSFGSTLSSDNSLIFRLCYLLFASIPEATCTSLTSPSENLMLTSLSVSKFMPAVLIGSISLTAVALSSTKKHLKYFFIPHVLFSVFASCVYFFSHHVGIYLAFLVFWAWTAFDSEGEERIASMLIKKTRDQASAAKIMRCILILICSAMLLVSITWTIKAYINEIRHEYYSAESTAQFMKDKGLDKATKLAAWSAPDTNDIYLPVGLLPYFDKSSVFANLNGGDPQKAYTIHIRPSDDEVKTTLQNLKEQGAPEMLLGNVRLDLIFGEDTEDLPHYVPVYRSSGDWPSIWKSNCYDQAPFYIYVREDALEKYDVSRIEVHE